MAGKQYSVSLKLWLWIGLAMIFVQVMIGGITRLTDSGLSITEWEVVKGVIPPLNQAQWQDAFHKYKTAAEKNYETLHPDMTLQEFKWIYFWEYFHRLWARTMGLVFLIPFIYFLWKKQIDKQLLKKLIAVIFFASLAAIFGWIMVKSGLNQDNRTWVSAYKLVTHLLIAIATFCSIYWAILSVSCLKAVRMPSGELSKMRTLIWSILIVTFLQVIVGGLMAGMRAELIHPHWPVFLHSEGFFHALTDLDSFSSDDLLNYEPSIFIKAWVQFIHRSLPYIILALAAIIYVFARGKYWFGTLRRPIFLLIGLILLQGTLGVLTIVNSIGSIPVILAVIHQLVALILIAAELHILYRLYTAEEIHRTLSAENKGNSELA